MANQKISQFSPTTALASGDFLPVVISGGTNNARVGVDVLDNRYYATASGSAVYAIAYQALNSGTVALASGNAALASAATAQSSAATAQSSGNAALSSAALKLPLSGGVVSGQFAQNIVSLGLNGSGIDTALGNYFTATISGATTVVFSGVPSNVSYGFTYEVNHQTGTITWPGAVSWPAATPPTLTTGKTHLFIFVTDDSGSSWRASSLINYTT